MLRRYGLWGSLVLVKNLILTRLFFPSSRIIRAPFRVRGRKSIDLGKGLTTGINCRLDAFSDKESPCLVLGHDVQINDSVHIAAINSVTIGNRVLIASQVFITDHNHGCYGAKDIHSSPLVPPVKRELSGSPVSIGDDVWIGEFVAVLPGVTIGNGSIIGAMSVVTRNIPENSIAVGAPARVIKQYNFEQQKWISI
jgi:lipopolysaccharide O-acetyltransferase